MLSAVDDERLTRTGAGTPIGDLHRRFWRPVLRSRELPEPDGAPVRVRVLDIEGRRVDRFGDVVGRVR